MKLKDAIQNLGQTKATAIAHKLSNEMNVDWEAGACFVFKVITNDPNRVPGNIGGVNDDEHTAIKKWLQKYQTGKEGCASKRVSNPPGTVADPIIEEIIGARLTNLTSEELNKVTYAHRLGMSAENILGLMLEEYLAINLQAHGWHCAWGETVKSVDFVNEDGSLLQIKNRSNSENSSSSAVRDGTEVEKWYRIKADRIEYMWTSLNRICGTSHLSEEDFVSFVTSTIKSNPNCLAVEENNPWQQQKN
ncbi:MAG TPA: SinI family restriction endonuclease [Cellvibrio sp.]|nr:SinI family restriction endonuclease [Cellvibrio sp.]